MQTEYFTPLKISTKNSLKRKIFAAVVLLAVVMGIGTYLNNNNYFTNNQKTADTQKEVESLTEKVAKLIILPDEKPAVATVIAEEKLKDKPFFTDVKNGDKVLFFQNSKKAILYRPSVNKIVNVAVISQELIDEASQSAKTDNGEAIKLAIYYEINASQQADLVESKIGDNFPQFEIVEKNTAAANYASSFVIDLEGDNPEVASQLAQELGAQLSSFPSQEKRPNAQLLLIIAN